MSNGGFGDGSGIPIGERRPSGSTRIGDTAILETCPKWEKFLEGEGKRTRSSLFEFISDGEVSHCPWCALKRIIERLVKSKQIIGRSPPSSTEPSRNHYHHQDGQKVILRQEIFEEKQNGGKRNSNRGLYQSSGELRTSRERIHWLRNDSAVVSSRRQFSSRLLIPHLMLNESTVHRFLARTIFVPIITFSVFPSQANFSAQQTLGQRHPRRTP